MYPGVVRVHRDRLMLESLPAEWASYPIIRPSPLVTHVGGNVTVHPNHDVVTWRGVAEGARIDGDFNSPVTNGEIFAAIEATELVVGRTTIVCAYRWRLHRDLQLPGHERRDLRGD